MLPVSIGYNFAAFIDSSSESIRFVSLTTFIPAFAASQLYSRIIFSSGAHNEVGIYCSIVSGFPIFSFVRKSLMVIVGLSARGLFHLKIFPTQPIPAPPTIIAVLTRFTSLFRQTLLLQPFRSAWRPTAFGADTDSDATELGQLSDTSSSSSDSDDDPTFLGPCDAPVSRQWRKEQEDAGRDPEEVLLQHLLTQHSPVGPFFCATVCVSLHDAATIHAQVRSTHPPSPSLSGTWPARDGEGGVFFLYFFLHTPLPFFTPRPRRLLHRMKRG